jgi:hypothetical protein
VLLRLASTDCPIVFCLLLPPLLDSGSSARWLVTKARFANVELRSVPTTQGLLQNMWSVGVDLAAWACKRTLPQVKHALLIAIRTGGGRAGKYTEKR